MVFLKRKIKNNRLKSSKFTILVFFLSIFLNQNLAILQSSFINECFSKNPNIFESGDYKFSYNAISFDLDKNFTVIVHCAENLSSIDMYLRWDGVISDVYLAKNKGKKFSSMIKWNRIKTRLVSTDMYFGSSKQKIKANRMVVYNDQTIQSAKSVETTLFAPILVKNELNIINLNLTSELDTLRRQVVLTSQFSVEGPQAKDFRLIYSAKSNSTLSSLLSREQFAPGTKSLSLPIFGNYSAIPLDIEIYLKGEPTKLLSTPTNIIFTGP